MEGQEGNQTHGTNWSLSHGFECGTRGSEPIGFQPQHSGSVVSGTISVTFTRCPESPSAASNAGGGRRERRQPPHPADGEACEG